MLSLIFFIASIGLLFPLIAPRWLIRDALFTREVRKICNKYGYEVLTVNETRKKFSIPDNITARRIPINFGYIVDRETVQFREVTLTYKQNTITCLAARRTAFLTKPKLYFNIDLPKAFQ